MLTQTQRRAVVLLFKLTDEEIIRELKTSRKTLDAWKRSPEFSQAVCDYVRENRRTAIRFLSQRYVEAARELESLIKSKDEKIKHKAIVDVLKASGLLKDADAEEGDYIDSLLGQDEPGCRAQPDDESGEED